MPLNVDRELRRLKQMAPSQLRERYIELFDEQPSSMNKGFLWKRIIWRMSVLAERDIGEAARRKALELANDADVRTTAPRDFLASPKPAPEACFTLTRRLTVTSDARLPMPGAELVRSYKGRKIIVTVLEDGFFYEGEHPAIVNEDVFGRVQTLLRENRRNGGRDVRNRYGALLKGLLYCGHCNKAMVHAYTVQRNRRYRYYVCSHAQKNGWSTCPVKSLPAGDIEGFVLEVIRGIGQDDALAAEVIGKARAQARERTALLKSERTRLEADLAELDRQVKHIVRELGEHDGPDTTGRLADLQDRMRETEQQATRVREELLTMEAERIDEGKLATALSLFDPVWDALSPRERVRVMQLLIERVEYAGEGGKVSVSFRPAGIRSLAIEAQSSPEPRP